MIASSVHISDLATRDAITMGDVVPFKRWTSTRLPEVELALLNAINTCPLIGSSEIIAVPREPRDVTLMHAGSKLGTWYGWKDRLVFMPACAAGAVAQVLGVSAAHEATLKIAVNIRSGSSG